MVKKPDIKALLADPDVPATVYLTVLSDWFSKSAPDGAHWLSWDELRLMQELQEDFGNIPEQAFAKICAARAALSPGNEDLLGNSLDYFTAIISGISGNQIFQAGEVGDLGSYSAGNPDVDDVLWGITELRLLLGERFPKSFCPDIRGYLGELFASEGFNLPGEFGESVDDDPHKMSNAADNLDGDPGLGYALSQAAVEQELSRRKTLFYRIAKMFEYLEKLGFLDQADQEVKDMAYSAAMQLVDD